MIRKVKFVIFAASLSTGLLLPAAHADTITLTLTPSTEIATPGSTVTYSATLAAPVTNGSPVYLNNDTIDLNDPAGVTTDGTNLLLNFDADLTPGESENGGLFTVTLPTTAVAGMYTGDFILQGGSSFSSQVTLDVTPFTLDVLSPAGAAPEPSSLLLLGTGLIGSVGVAKRRWA